MADHELKEKIRLSVKRSSVCDKNLGWFTKYTTREIRRMIVECLVRRLQEFVSSCELSNMPISSVVNPSDQSKISNDNDQGSQIENIATKTCPIVEFEEIDSLVGKRASEFTKKSELFSENNKSESVISTPPVDWLSIYSSLPDEVISEQEIQAEAELESKLKIHDQSRHKKRTRSKRGTSNLVRVKLYVSSKSSHKIRNKRARAEVAKDATRHSLSTNDPSRPKRTRREIAASNKSTRNEIKSLSRGIDTHVSSPKQATNANSFLTTQSHSGITAGSRGTDTGGIAGSSSLSIQFDDNILRNWGGDQLDSAQDFNSAQDHEYTAGSSWINGFDSVEAFTIFDDNMEIGDNMTSSMSPNNGDLIQGGRYYDNDSEDGDASSDNSISSNSILSEDFVHNDIGSRSTSSSSSTSSVGDGREDDDDELSSAESESGASMNSGLSNVSSVASFASGNEDGMHQDGSLINAVTMAERNMDMSSGSSSESLFDDDKSIVLSVSEAPPTGNYLPSRQTMLGKSLSSTENNNTTIEQIQDRAFDFLTNVNYMHTI